MTTPAPLTEAEKAWFDTIRDKAPILASERGHLFLTRMLLDGQDVAVIGCDVYNRFVHGKREGAVALALVLDGDSPLLSRLTAMDGTPASVVSPFDLDPSI